MKKLFTLLFAATALLGLVGCSPKKVEELKTHIPELKISLLEDEPELKELVDSVFYSYDIFLMHQTNVVKIIEGNNMIGRLKFSNNIQMK